MTAENRVPETKTPEKKAQRKRALIILSLVILIIIIVYAIYWVTVLRFEQSTDDAYVTGNPIQIATQISGTVVSLNADNTHLVKSGDILVNLDATDAQQAYERAKTSLASSVRQIQQLMINSKQLQANIELRQTDVNQLTNDLSRRAALAKTQAIGQEDLQHAQNALKSAQAALVVAQQQYHANQAALLNTPLEKQPLVEQAATQLREAWLNLQRTQVRSPITGYVAQRSVQVGMNVSPNVPLMAVIDSNDLWVSANFKETQLADIRIGQPATLISDLYGKHVVYHGIVSGIDMGTGSAFSILPAQNATGNWIKVVQRLPVKITLKDDELKRFPLRIGLSMNVTIDTHNKNGEILAQTTTATPVYQSQALTYDLAPINAIIAQIIQQNTLLTE